MKSLTICIKEKLKINTNSKTVDDNLYEIGDSFWYDKEDVKKMITCKGIKEILQYLLNIDVQQQFGEKYKLRKGAVKFVFDYLIFNLKTSYDECKDEDNGNKAFGHFLDWISSYQPYMMQEMMEDDELPQGVYDINIEDFMEDVYNGIIDRYAKKFPNSGY